VASAGSMDRGLIWEEGGKGEGSRGNEDGLARGGVKRSEGMNVD